MAGFFKMFFAALLAIFVFIAIIVLMAIAALFTVGSSQNNQTPEKSVLVINLSEHFAEISAPDPLMYAGRESTPALYDLIRLIKHAKYDAAISGIYIRASSNNNSFASSEELRKAVSNFKEDGKFVIAYADAIDERAYQVALAADRIYCSPIGGLEWDGIAMQMPFIKTALEKLQIQPQIFYAGKFKSATEPLRDTQMTEANRLQSTELLQDLYGNFLSTTSRIRKIDIATLQGYADSGSIVFASQALKAHLVDGLKYDDEIKDEIRNKLGIERTAKINFISPGRYAQTADYKQSGSDRIAVIYAEGDIVDGGGDRGLIGGDTYRNYIQRARLDDNVNAVVVRVNSGGGSSMASEVIWREIALTKKVKPVVVSFGDVAASGGYYMSCAADMIFAQPNTITGSIGVFTVVPNMQQFFHNKLGVSFDEVHTSPNANMYSITKPLTPAQRVLIQNQIDSIYLTFKKRVADGRKKSVEYIDSIAQGRVWSGARAIQLGLIDKIGGLDEAIAAAAAKAKINSYSLREYPGPPSVLEMFFENRTESTKNAAIREELGEEGLKTYTLLKHAKQFIGVTQARMPFDLNFR